VRKNLIPDPDPANNSGSDRIQIRHTALLPKSRVSEPHKSQCGSGSNIFKQGDFLGFACISCTIFNTASSTVPADAGFEPRAVAKLALAARRSNHQARSHPHPIFLSQCGSGSRFLIPYSGNLNILNIL